ncbi:MAG: cupin domain-containing protein [Caldilineaceae bacterium]|nr:cupin domain-containing protein [Caldilineaceae bacterium]
MLGLADANVMSHYDQHTIRQLSSMTGYYLDHDAFATLLAQADPVIYEVYGIDRPAVSGELISGITILHPGKVGQEYFMTKGHFHAVLETGEVYYALRGNGLIVMETPEGESRVEPFAAGQVVYIPPRWAHRTVNIGDEDLLFFWVCPAQAGHDYGTIAQQGFRKLVIETAGMPTTIDNSQWSAS